ncbi:hypothetical protein BCR34DRAFT_567549 [Clohesyomyces aquaticus]|uniref:Uncharacterized protein n=1 Tax=Clohesyomyces aquaticus TaxID=1231657 RepID=A0A1Y1ZIE8_9PLEO|nr:hypothetical protein BCR34DRAFT_567549 [Clohesyomyces aquaticus]
MSLDLDLFLERRPFERIHQPTHTPGSPSLIHLPMYLFTVPEIRHPYPEPPRPVHLPRRIAPATEFTGLGGGRPV